jgi:hypothetical protein
MLSLTQLWLPILLSVVAVFVASSIIHMASPWHKGDYPRMANEDAVMDAMRPLDIPPGDYFFPRPSGMAEMKSPEFRAKLERGPAVLMTVFPKGGAPMGGTFVKWILYLFVVIGIAAHVASRSVAEHADAHHVFHQVALVAFAGFGLGLWQLTIWYRRSLSITLKSTVDALVYAMITGGIFAWWWPR